MLSWPVLALLLPLQFAICSAIDKYINIEKNYTSLSRRVKVKYFTILSNKQGKL